jgi:type I restriction enzyme S subunit
VTPAVSGNNEWQSERLEDICAQITDGKHGDCQYEANSGFYFISCKDVAGGNVNYGNARQITEADFLDTHRRTKFAPSDILITNSGTIGRMAIAPDTELTRRTTFQKSVAILKPITTRVEPTFLYYALQSDIRRLIEFAGGTAQKNLLLRDLRAFEIELPSLPVQRRIAGILSTYDELIQRNQRRIRILETMARALYRNWFVELRFPGHGKVPRLDSPLGPIPKGWEVKKLSKLVTTQYGYTESSNEEPVGPKYLRGMDMNKTSYIDWSQVPYCPISPEDKDSYSVKKGDVFVIRMADPGKVGIVEQDANAVFASYLIRVRPKDDRILPYFLFHLLDSTEYQAYVSGASTGTTRRSASAGVITDFEFALPSKQLVAEFEKRAASFREMLTTLLQQIQNLRRTRDLLLPRLLSAQVRL